MRIVRRRDVRGPPRVMVWNPAGNPRSRDRPCGRSRPPPEET
ncbi:hypothetical protein ATKI12_8220 [Kitasatospora sp. Ki12]